MTVVAAILFAAYAAATLTRAALAWVFLLREPPAPQPIDEADVTVLQPILSGDPTLLSGLRATLAASPQARFLWLVDDDDDARVEVEQLALQGGARVLIGPPPCGGESPKAVKLARGLPSVQTRWIAVLDDDTVLPAGGLVRAVAGLRDGDLATGLPLYVAQGGLWSRLLAAAVNGAAILTYPPASLMGQAQTINGMFYVTRTDDLRALGGFEAIRDRLTDDYAMAQLYLRAGRRLLQTPVVHPITTTVRDFPRYCAQIHRWMVFIRRYLRENWSPFTALLIIAPTLAPPLMLLAGAGAGPGWLLAGALLLLAKAVVTAGLRRRFFAARTTVADLALEPLADVLAPFQFVAAMLRPHRLQWRTRRIRMTGDAITYE